MAEPDHESNDEQVWSADHPPTWALAQLNDYSGQTYIEPQDAFEWLLSLLNSDHVDESFAAESFDKSSKIAELLAERAVMAGDARGFVNVPDFETIVTVANASEIAVMVVGEDPSDYMALGGGFTEDGRHDQHMSALHDVFGVGDGVE